MARKPLQLVVAVAGIPRTIMSIHPACRLSHPFILEGACPWCGSTVATGCGQPVNISASGPQRQWNAAGICTWLTTAPRSHILLLLSGLIHRGSASDQILSITRSALQHPDRRVLRVAATVLTEHGHNVLESEAVRFESALQAAPDDLPLRILLLGYYYRRSFISPSARVARHQHILWIVKSAPELAFAGNPDTSLSPMADAALYNQVAQLWLDQVSAHPLNASIIGNAAAYFSNHDAQRGIELVSKVQKLEPTNPEWFLELGALYRSHVQKHEDSPKRRQLAAGALQELETLLQGFEDAYDRLWVLADFGYIAIEAGSFAKATAYATELLDHARAATDSYPDREGAFHHAHLILGRVALRLGDLEGAKQYLLKAGAVKGSPLLDSGGPGMILAKELLEKGESATVSEYLRLCAKFWETSDHRPEQWIYQIQAGQKPVFGNLVY